VAGTTPVLRVVEGGKAGDPRATLRDFYERYASSVYGRCLYLLKDRNKAEDAMQDVFARALTHVSEFRSQASPLTWLMKIATHHCLNTLRGERAQWLRVLRQDAQARQEGYGGPQALELRDAVRNVLSQVDEETQRAAIHYHVDEMTLEEVAILLGRSIPTVRKRLEHFATISGQELRP
jgi:RNA polymerase sigma-70 factor, ECF subfamily